MKDFKYFLAWCFLMLIAAIGGTFFNELMTEITSNHGVRVVVFLSWIIICITLFIKLDIWWNRKEDEKNQ